MALYINLNARADLDAARVAGEDPAMDVAAEHVWGLVKALAASHTKTGGYERSIHWGSDYNPAAKGVRDRVIWTDHPAADDIEFGHEVVANGKIRPDLPPGTHLGWAKGLYIFTRARGLA